LIYNQAIASHLYRIAQEAVYNALRHSSATRIGIELTEKPATIEMRVHDNGSGFSQSAASCGLGLRTMQQRATLMGGRVLVQPREEGGTEVICSVPKSGSK
jgi:two-component system CheB/CheR fusion protein